jgi:hypothetical protein
MSRELYDKATHFLMAIDTIFSIKLKHKTMLCKDGCVNKKYCKFNNLNLEK